MTVRIPRRSAVWMPSMCVACGRPGPALPRRISAAAGARAAQPDPGAGLDFPLCSSCYRHGKSFPGQGWLAFGLFVLDLFILLPAVMALSTLAGMLAEGTAGMIFKVFIFAVLFFSMIALTAELYEYLERRLGACRQAAAAAKSPVAIESRDPGGMTFSFSNEDFARRFAALNGGEEVEL